MMDARTNTLLQRAEDALEDLRAHLAGVAPEPGWTREEQRVGAVLSDALEAGGRLTVDQWRQIGLDRGYDPRGLSGFFTGHVPSMRSEGDERVLTDRGRREAEEWRVRTTIEEGMPPNPLRTAIDAVLPPNPLVRRGPDEVE